MKQLFLLPIFLLACKGNHSQSQNPSLKQDNPLVQKYWFAGEAEVNSYTLTQARYGELREGKAVLIFVSEPFLPEKQVKDEQGSKKSVQVLKLNYLKKFNTGVYDYSLMSSVFTPFNQENHAYKVSFSAQDWCGQSFQQINLRDKKYEIQLRSYFEKEADKDLKINYCYLEDAILTNARLNPMGLPVGEFDILPSSMTSRLLHYPLEPTRALAEIVKSGENIIYNIEFPSQERSKSILIEGKFPHRILSIEETYKDGWGADANVLTTVLSLDETRKLAYWKQNKREHSGLRDELNLD